MESLVWLLNGGAGRDPTAHWTPTSQPADVCKWHRLTGQTDQSGCVGRGLSAGRREDCQDRRREAGACHNQLGALSEYHSDSVCTHGCTKTSWLSLMRGVELKPAVETNFHCQHLIPFISLITLQNTAARGFNTFVSLKEFVQFPLMSCCRFSGCLCFILVRINKHCSESLTEVFVTVYITVIQLHLQSCPMFDRNTEQSLLPLPA